MRVPDKTLVALAGAFVALTAAVLAGLTLPWDEAALGALRATPGTPLATWAGVISTLADAKIAAPVAAALVAWAWLRRSRSDAVFVAVAVAHPWAYARLVKALVARPRPDGLEEASHAFPSGHATMAAAVYAVAFVWLAHGAGRRRFVAALALGGLLAVAVGLSRVVLGVHYPADIVAGWMLGALTALAVLFVASAEADRRTLAAPDAAPS